MNDQHSKFKIQTFIISKEGGNSFLIHSGKNKSENILVITLFFTNKHILIPSDIKTGGIFYFYEYNTTGTRKARTGNRRRYGQHDPAVQAY
jgi:hypothetical protein